MNVSIKPPVIIVTANGISGNRAIAISAEIASNASSAAAAAASAASAAISEENAAASAAAASAAAAAPFSSRADFIVWAGSASVAAGTVARVCLDAAPYVIEFRYVDALTAVIADIPGWAPVAPVYVQHYGAFPSANKTTPTTDYTARIIDAVNNTVGELIFTGWVKITDTVICPNTCRMNVPAGRAYGGFSIRTDFNFAAGCVLQFGTAETGPTMGDFGMWFEQPGSPANRAALFAYPPAIDISNTPRGTINSLRIEQGIDGIRGVGNCGGFKFGVIELGCFGTDFAIDGALDFVQADSIHVFPFGFASNAFKAAIFYDGVGYAANLGRVDNWTCDKFSSFRKKVALADTGGTARLPYIFNSMGLDGNGAQLQLGAGDTLIANLYSVKDALSTAPDIVVTAGRHTIANASLSGGGTATIDVQGGELSVSGRIHCNNNAVSSVTVSAGRLTLDSVALEWTDAARTAPFVLQSGTGVLRATGCSSPVATVGEAIRFTTDLLENFYDGSLVNQNITLPTSRSVGWYGDTQLHYASRAAAALARVPIAVKQISVSSGLVQLIYVEDFAGTALTTADGRKWSPPSDAVTPQHFGAVQSATIDSLFAYVAAGNYVSSIGGGKVYIPAGSLHGWSAPLVHSWDNVTFEGPQQGPDIRESQLGATSAVRQAAFRALMPHRIVAMAGFPVSRAMYEITTPVASLRSVQGGGPVNLCLDCAEIADWGVYARGHLFGVVDGNTVAWPRKASFVFGPQAAENLTWSRMDVKRNTAYQTAYVDGTIVQDGCFIFRADTRRLADDGVEVFGNCNLSTVKENRARSFSTKGFQVEDSDSILFVGNHGRINFLDSETAGYSTKSVSSANNYPSRHHQVEGGQGVITVYAAQTSAGRPAQGIKITNLMDNSVTVVVQPGNEAASIKGARVMVTRTQLVGPADSTSPSIMGAWFVGVGAKLSAAVTCANLTITPIPFDAEWVDTIAAHAAGVITIPAGIYQMDIAANVTFASNPTGYRRAYFQKSTDSGSSWIEFDGEPSVLLDAVATAPTRINLSGMFPVLPGEQYRLVVVQTSGDALDVATANTWMSARFY